jgi:peptidoglycan hydrolase CwlO-like protein
MPQTLEERVSYLEGKVEGVEEAIRKISADILMLSERIDHLEVTIDNRLNALEERIDRQAV